MGTNAERYDLEQRLAELDELLKNAQIVQNKAKRFSDKKPQNKPKAGGPRKATPAKHQADGGGKKADAKKGPSSPKGPKPPAKDEAAKPSASPGKKPAAKPPAKEKRVSGTPDAKRGGAKTARSAKGASVSPKKAGAKKDVKKAESPAVKPVEKKPAPAKKAAKKGSKKGKKKATLHVVELLTFEVPKCDKVGDPPVEAPAAKPVAQGSDSAPGSGSDLVVSGGSSVRPSEEEEFQVVVERTGSQRAASAASGNVDDGAIQPGTATAPLGTTTQGIKAEQRFQESDESPVVGDEELTAEGDRPQLFPDSDSAGEPSAHSEIRADEGGEEKRAVTVPLGDAGSDSGDDLEARGPQDEFGQETESDGEVAEPQDEFADSGDAEAAAVAEAAHAQADETLASQDAALTEARAACGRDQEIEAGDDGELDALATPPHPEHPPPAPRDDPVDDSLGSLTFSDMQDPIRESAPADAAGPSEDFSSELVVSKFDDAGSAGQQDISFGEGSQGGREGDGDPAEEG